MAQRGRDEAGELLLGKQFWDCSEQGARTRDGVLQLPNNEGLSSSGFAKMADMARLLTYCQSAVDDICTICVGLLQEPGEVRIEVLVMSTDVCSPAAYRHAEVRLNSRDFKAEVN